MKKKYEEVLEEEFLKLEELGVVVKDIDYGDFNDYVSTPGDLTHRVGFLMRDQSFVNDEFSGWYDLLASGRRLVYRNSGYNENSRRQVAINAYMTSTSGGYPWHATYGIKSIFRKRKWNTPEYHKPGFIAIFSDLMKDKMASLDITDKEFFDIYNRINLFKSSDEMPLEPPRPMDTNKQETPKETVSHYDKYSEQFREYCRNLISWRERLEHIANKNVNNPFEWEHDIVTSEFIGMIAFYRFLRQNNFEKLKEAESLMYGAGRWDKADFGVRLSRLSKDETNYTIEPCDINREDIRAIVIPTLEDRRFKLVEF